MSNPLYITEILEEVFKHLDIQDLAVASCVNKTWRLVARKIIYQNRSAIIYGFFKGYLNNLRLDRYDLTRDILAFIPFRSFKSLKVFRYAFGLDIKSELLEIRKQFQKEYKQAKKTYKKLDKEVTEKHSLINFRVPDSKENYKARFDYDKAREKSYIADYQRFELCKKLVNFEYFLVRFGNRELLTDQEIDVIIDKLQPLDDCEVERKWGDIAIDDWDGENPNMIYVFLK